ncbi:hypothetical protein [Maliponia aquimaris]|uniref:hypothetical protein n=1 Tax=Maliponia aquimaris TaxID=1673631 RepID=UPI00113FDA45|nr:hypothetical protein [Maliponia aquimaris]
MAARSALPAELSRSAFFCLVLCLVPSLSHAGFLKICNTSRVQVDFTLLEGYESGIRHHVTGWYPLDPGNCFSEYRNARTVHAFTFRLRDTTSGDVAPVVFDLDKPGFLGISSICGSLIDKTDYRVLGGRSNAAICSQSGHEPLPISFGFRFGSNEYDQHTVNIGGISADEARRKIKAYNAPKEPPPKPTAPKSPPLKAKPPTCSQQPGADISSADPSEAFVQQQKRRIAELYKEHCSGKSDACRGYIQSRLMLPIATRRADVCETPSHGLKPCRCEERRADLAYYTTMRNRTSTYPEEHLTMFEKLVSGKAGQLERAVNLAVDLMKDDRPPIPPPAGFTTK